MALSFGIRVNNLRTMVRSRTAGHVQEWSSLFIVRRFVGLGFAGLRLVEGP